MSILGGTNRLKLRGATLVVYNASLDSTTWIIEQVKEGIKKAQGSRCPVSVFIVDENPDDSLLGLPNSDSFTRLDIDSESWVRSITNSVRKSDVVISTGLQVNEQLAPLLPRDIIYLPILVDRLDERPHFLPGDQSALETVSERATAVFFNSEPARSNAESIAVSLCERTRVFGPQLVDQELTSDSSLSAGTQLVQTTSSITKGVNKLFTRIAGELRELRSPPVTSIVGTPHEKKLFSSGDYGDARFLPGVVFSNYSSPLPSAINHVMVIDDSDAETPWRINQAQQIGARPLLLSKINSSILVQVLTSKMDVPSEWASVNHERPESCDLAESICALLKPRQSLKKSVTRTVLAGSDFKFSSLLLRELEESSDIEFVLDRARSNTSVDPKHSRVLGEWADVVITEFLNEQAVWYSQNLAPGKRLIVHMHGFELYKNLSNRLNIHGVFRVVVPSEGYRQKVLQNKNWPADKIKVIHNGGSVPDLLRPKVVDAKYTLGLVGWVPALKRVDRALDLLQLLIKKDSRYTLEVRGALPWNYKWEWNKPAHRDMYLQILSRLRNNPELSNHVTFGPFGADMGNWLRGIGWVLSTSVRESFHLAPVEGMLSGSIPIVWKREGAADIYGPSWVHDNTTDASEFVLNTNASEFGWNIESKRAFNEAAERYADRVIRQQWHELIVRQEGTTHQEASRVLSQHELNSSDGSPGKEESAPDLFSGNVLISENFSKKSYLDLPPFLLSLQHDLKKKNTHGGDSDYVHIQVAALARETPTFDPKFRGTVLLAPPVESREWENYDWRYFERFAPLIPVISPERNGPMPLTGYLKRVSRELQRQAKLVGARNFVVDGPYWAVLVAIQASVETGGSVIWDIREEPLRNSETFKSSHVPITDDPLAFASRIVAQATEKVLVDYSLPVPLSILEMFSEAQLVTDIPDVSERDVRAPVRLQNASLPLISVVIPSHRSDGSLNRALRSLVDQTYPRDRIEILIVLNGTGNENKSWLEKYVLSYPEFSWHILQSPSGVAPARNLGLVHATGEFLTFLDDDDVLEINYLASMAAVCETDTIVAARMVDRQSNGQLKTDTNAARQVKSLGLNKVKAYTKSGLFGAAGGKLIPTRLLANVRFKDNLSSGEDVAFLGQVIAEHDVDLVAAYPMHRNTYIRSLSSSSVSRPSEMTERFAVWDRLEVAHHLWSINEQKKSKPLARGIVTGLIHPQVSIMAQSICQRPELARILSSALHEYPTEFGDFVKQTLPAEVTEKL